MVFYNPRSRNVRFSPAAWTAPQVELREVPIPTFSLKEQVLLPWIARRHGVQILHSPYYVKPYFLTCPSVVTIHDIIPSRYPEYLPSWKTRLSYSIAMRLAIGTATLVIADSQGTREDMAHYFGIPPTKVRVVPLAADEFQGGESSPQPPPQGSYILSVGINKPHKNLLRLLEAYAQAQVSLPLVIAGREDSRFPLLRDAVRTLGLEERVTLAGEVGEERLQRLYLEAAFFVFPSLAEGFGLPPLEAMASGVPVIASRIPVVTEVVGDAALLVDPESATDMAQAINRLAADGQLRASLQARGLARAKLFSWRETARKTWEVYQEVLGDRG
ncbi:MAG: glycosyltransferase family 4 protein [Chloroflexi bacterium]|nr:glycosyltransferase family 4 protein [Chloroflexota bacterium]